MRAYHLQAGTDPGFAPGLYDPAGAFPSLDTLTLELTAPNPRVAAPFQVPPMPQAATAIAAVRFAVALGCRHCGQRMTLDRPPMRLGPCGHTGTLLTARDFLHVHIFVSHFLFL